MLKWACKASQKKKIQWVLKCQKQTLNIGTIFQRNCVKLAGHSENPSRTRKPNVPLPSKQDNNSFQNCNFQKTQQMLNKQYYGFVQYARYLLQTLKTPISSLKDEISILIRSNNKDLQYYMSKQTSLAHSPWVYFIGCWLFPNVEDATY